MHDRPNRILIQYGEIALKRKNVGYFRRTLQRNIHTKLAALGMDTYPAKSHDRLVLDIPKECGESVERIVQVVAEVPGAVWIAPAWWIPADEAWVSRGRPNHELIETKLTGLARVRHEPGGAFAIRFKRADGRFPNSSEEMERRLGTLILEETAWDKVDLSNPTRTFRVDAYPDGVYLSCEWARGAAGLPVGTSGRVLSLLSGGIDSPVAAYLLARRGCKVDFLHFTVNQIPPEQLDDYKISRLASVLSRYTLRSRLYLVPYDHFEVAMLAEKTEYELQVFRRFMAATGEVLARRLRAHALVTGDSLGQVASQTIQNIVSNSRAVDQPIFRPLIAYDKQEIIALARRIGTYDLAIEPYKDCCALISQNPRTSSNHAELQETEERLFPDYRGLIDRSLKDATVLEFRCGRRVA